MKLKDIFPKPWLGLAVLFVAVVMILFLQQKYQAVSVAVSGGKEDVLSNQSISSVKEISTKEINQKRLVYPQAPDFVGIEHWINSEPLHIGDLRGKVVLVDFWTYTCINCIRTLPYLKAWHAMYAPEGLVIIGVHTPEFAFEKKYENVLSAAKEQGLLYPIAQDNEYGTWRAYGNRYWPHEYLIDIDGFVRHEHIGEGGYEETEREIQKLLQERRERFQMNEKMNGTLQAAKIIGGVDFSQIKSPEIYLGALTTRGNFGNKEGYHLGGVIEYIIPTIIEKNTVYIRGMWKNNEDNLELAGENGTVLLQYDAKQVNIVASAGAGAEIMVLVDGSVKNSVVVGEEKLYTVVEGEDYGVHTVELRVRGRGFKMYTFTFG